VTQTTWLTLLICLNLVLATGIIVFGLPPATALGQGAGLASNYLAVTGRVQSDFDALYLVDLRERTLHIFYFIRGGNDLQWAGYRDLERDFRNN
jgi:hypothetical protein